MFPLMWKRENVLALFEVGNLYNDNNLYKYNLHELFFPI